MKACKKCGDDKPLSDFTKDKTKKDGMRAHCKLCVKNRMSATYAESRKKMIEGRKLAEITSSRLTIIKGKLFSFEGLK